MNCSVEDGLLFLKVRCGSVRDFAGRRVQKCRKACKTAQSLGGLLPRGESNEPFERRRIELRREIEICQLADGVGIRLMGRL